MARNVDIVAGLVSFSASSGACSGFVVSNAEWIFPGVQSNESQHNVSRGIDIT